MSDAGLKECLCRAGELKSCESARLLSSSTYQGIERSTHLVELELEVVKRKVGEIHRSGFVKGEYVSLADRRYVSRGVEASSNGLKSIRARA